MFVKAKIVHFSTGRCSFPHLFARPGSETYTARPARKQAARSTHFYIPDSAPGGRHAQRFDSTESNPTRKKMHEQAFCKAK